MKPWIPSLLCSHTCMGRAHLKYNLTLSTVIPNDSHRQRANEIIQMPLKIFVILVLYTVKTTQEQCTV
jgi:hypothetical protein